MQRAACQPGTNLSPTYPELYYLNVYGNSAVRAPTPGAASSSRSSSLPPPVPEVAKKKPKPVPRFLCAVCDDGASKYNFGVISCNACRQFFKRIVNKEVANKLPMCRNGNDCDVNLTNRKECVRCRYKKCLQNGMRPDLVARASQTYAARAAQKQDHVATQPSVEPVPTIPVLPGRVECKVVTFETPYLIATCSRVPVHEPLMAQQLYRPPVVNSISATQLVRSESTLSSGNDIWKFFEDNEFNAVT